MPVTFVRPAALLLLASLVLLYFIYRASLRGLPPGRRRFVLALRLLVATLVIVSLAGPLLRHSADSISVAFLVDQSDSVSPEEQARALAWIRESVAAKGSRDQGEVIAFASDALLDIPLSAAEDVPEPASTIGRDHTDLAAAIRLAISTLPSSTARKILVLSDGAENAGNGLEEGRLAAAADIPIYFVPLSGREGPEVIVRQIDSPATLREQETFTIRVVADSNTASPATIRVLLDGRLDSTHTVQLSPGANAFAIPHEPLATGFHSFQVRIEPAADTIAENNEGISYSMVVGKAKVLVVEGTSGAGRFLDPALRAAGIEVAVRPALSIPSEAAALRDFDSVVLLNVPASALSLVQQQAIKIYVQSFGGGLVVVGGDQSYGVGGYAGTPLEEAMPVRMDLRGRKVQSSVALILVIDTSGSMGEGPAGATKMDLAKQAARQSTALLGEQDQIGVIAFEDDWRWVVQPTFLTDPEQVKQQIGTLAPGGGTQIFPAVREAYRALLQREAKVRHIILMSDGIAPPGDYDTLTAQMRRDNITLSAIAVGTDADFGLLRRLAEKGKGRYYEGLDPFDVPQLTVKETLEVARAAIVEEQVRPVRVASSGILDGLEMDGAPPLAGYIATTAKPSSNTILMSKHEDPLLVEWQYGLGEVVAWTSDAENRWAADWITWPQFSQFWAQVVKRTIPTNLERNVHVAISQQGDRARIVVDSLGDSGGYLNFLESEATVVDPKGTQQTIPLQQTSPGRYEGSFPATEQGAYSLAVTQRSAQGQAPVATQATGFVIPYSAEYRDFGGNKELLGTLAELTGGAELIEPAEAFAHTGRTVAGGRELWPFLLAAALVLFLIDVGARRLRVGPADIRRGWHALLETWRARSRPIAQPAADRLLSVKRRLRTADDHTPAARHVRRQSSPAAFTRRNEMAGAQSSEVRSPTPMATMGARLLEAKKRAKPTDQR